MAKEGAEKIDTCALLMFGRAQVLHLGLLHAHCNFRTMLIITKLPSKGIDTYIYCTRRDDRAEGESTRVGVRDKKDAEVDRDGGDTRERDRPACRCWVRRRTRKVYPPCPVIYLTGVFAVWAVSDQTIKDCTFIRDVLVVLFTLTLDIQFIQIFAHH